MATVLEQRRAPAGQLRLRGAAGWLLPCVLIVGVAAVDPSGFAPFGPLKVTAIAAGVLTAATALGGSALSLDRRVTVVWALLLGWMLVATSVAEDPVHAWLGTPDRRLGWLSWLLFGLAWCCGHATSAPPARRRLLRGGALAAGVLGLYALAELAGVAPAAGTFAGGRLGGPYGQPAYLGAAGVLLTPLAVAATMDTRHSWWWRGAGAVAAALGAFAVLASQTRAAWVGLALASVVVAPRAWRAARRRPAATAVGLAAVTAVLALTPVGARLVSIADLDGTARGRVDEWRTAVAAVAEAPLLGHGPEGYRVAFPRVVDAAYARAHGREVIPDRAHNGVLDVAAAGGVPAAAAYLLLLLAVSVPAWRAARGRDVLHAGAGIGVLAYVLQQQLLFPAMEVDPLFWILAGAVGAAAAGTAPGGDAGDGGSAALGPSIAVRVPPALAGGLAVATAAVLVAGGLEVAADRALQRAASASPVGRTAALAEADRAAGLRPDSIRARYVAARIAARGSTITDVDAALDRLEDGLRISPSDPALRTEHARLLLERAERSGLPADVARAREELAALVEEDPAHPDHRLRLAAALAIDGETEAADAHLAAAEHLAPRGATASIERARLALRRDDIPAARAALARARRVEPDHPALPTLTDEVGGR